MNAEMTWEVSVPHGQQFAIKGLCCPAWESGATLSNWGAVNKKVAGTLTVRGHRTPWQPDVVQGTKRWRRRGGDVPHADAGAGMPKTERGRRWLTMAAGIYTCNPNSASSQPSDNRWCTSCVREDMPPGTSADNDSDIHFIKFSKFSNSTQQPASTLAKHISKMDLFALRTTYRVWVLNSTNNMF